MKKYWQSFIRWKGWSAFIHWSGWKKIFCIHPALAVLLIIASAAGLVWVFLNGMEEHPAAYGIYVISFYTLVAAVVQMPKIIRGANSLLHRNRVTNRILSDRELRFRSKLYMRQIVDLCYGGMKTAAGLFYGSSWLLTDGLYNLAQGAIELFQILRRRKVTDLSGQWKSYRLCGWLLLVLHLFMTGPIFLMINRGMGEYYPDVIVIATAAFTFYKLISAFVGVAKDRRHRAPIDSSVRMLNLSQALFSLFSLQVSMFHTFGGDFAARQLMNNLTGSGVCILVVATGIYMIRRGNRELKNI